MSQRIAGTLTDLTRHDGCLVAECQCGRTVLVSIHVLEALFRRRHWSVDFRAVPDRLRCTECDRRRPRVWYAQPPVPAWGEGLTMVINAPKGVSPMDWARADDRERRRLVARVRG